MMNTKTPIKISSKLKEIANKIGTSESLIEKSKVRYEAIATWLSRPESQLSNFDINIYPQGSIGLGTTNKPINNKEEYDVDLVCEVSIKKSEVSQKQLKELVGFEIKAYASANSMSSEPEEGKRCWTLNYSSDARFHADILPALSDVEGFKSLLESKGVNSNEFKTGICITDNSLPRQEYEYISSNWPVSNPKGYLEWFKSRMKVRFIANKQLLAESKATDITEIPDYLVKTPLQQAIQLLKRHRDLMFKDCPDLKPISIIITTLAARAYNNQNEILDSLLSIVKNMSSSIQNKNGITWIENPSNPLENFADKWQENSQLEENYFKWIKQASADLETLVLEKDDMEIDNRLEYLFGVPNTYKKKGSSSALVSYEQTLPSCFNVPHKRSLNFPENIVYRLEVSAFASKLG